MNHKTCISVSAIVLGFMSAGCSGDDGGDGDTDTTSMTGDTSTGDTSTGDTSTGDTSTGDTSTGDTAS